jgi:hypothetical protein
LVERLDDYAATTAQSFLFKGEADQCSEHYFLPRAVDALKESIRLNDCSYARMVRADAFTYGATVRGDTDLVESALEDISAAETFSHEEMVIARRKLLVFVEAAFLYRAKRKEDQVNQHYYSTLPFRPNDLSVWRLLIHRAYEAWCRFMGE